jgi:hypothetical protein
MGNVGLPQRSRGATGSLTDRFHGGDHPFSGEVLQDDPPHGAPRVACP